MINFDKLKDAYADLEVLASGLDEGAKAYIEHIRNDIMEFMIDNEPVKKGTVSLWDFTSHDNNRLVMTGVYHDKERKVAVATDGHVLVADKDIYDENKTDNTDKFAGRMPVDKYGKFIDGRYPNWHDVVPEKTNEFKTFHITVKDVDEYIKKCNAFMKLNGFTGRYAEKPVYYVKEADAWFNANYLRMFLLASDGEINISDPVHAACYWGPTRTAILMPLYKNENFDKGDGIYLTTN